MRKEKQLLLDDIKEKIDGSNALVLTRYQNLTPDLSDELRKSLRQAGGSFSVVKKRILLNAAKEAGMTLDRCSKVTLA